MILKTKFYCEIPHDTLSKYFDVLVGKVFKILPLAEDGRSSAKVYLDGLHREVKGLKHLFWVMNKDPMFVSLLSILTWLTYNIDDEECTIDVIRKEVFDAIAICQDLRDRIASESEADRGDINE